MMNKTILKLLLSNPFYGYMATRLVVEETEAVKHLKITAKLKLQYNIEWFNSLSDTRKIGVVMHELLHLILLHPLRGEGKDEKIWTVACDMAVNEQLDAKYLNRDSVTVGKVAKIIHMNLEDNKSAEYYYDKLNALEAPVSLLGLEGEVLLQDEEGTQLAADLVSQESVDSIDEKILKDTIEEVVNQAFSEGEIELGFKKYIDECNTFHINWRNTLKRFLTARGKLNTRRSYKRQSRRFDYLPGTKRAISVRALVAVDESGSISNSIMEQFYSELRKINKITGANIEVVRFDTECTKPVSLNAFIKDSSRLKNGGTDFKPVFELADELKMPLIIVFTDGDGPAPESVNQKVLWVITEGGQKPASYGQYITFTEGA